MNPFVRKFYALLNEYHDLRDELSDDELHDEIYWDIVGYNELALDEDAELYVDELEGRIEALKTYVKAKKMLNQYPPIFC